MLVSERAESCTVWLLRYRLRVTSAPSHSAHKGEEHTLALALAQARTHTMDEHFEDAFGKKDFELFAAFVRVGAKRS